jgi:hypothetical protein
MEKKYSKRFRIQGRQTGAPGEKSEERAYYSGIISTDELDSYFSRMSESTLKNFAEGANEGVTVLDSHKHNTAGIGMSTKGRYDDGKVYSDFYIVRDVPLGSAQSYSTTDGFITMIDDGALRDISVGFYGGNETCDICHENIWTWSCRHWPGVDYIIEEDGVKKIITCTTTIEGATLSEYSLVFDGATPGAEVTEKANYLAENGFLDIKQKHFIENRFNVRFKQGMVFPDKVEQEEIDKIENQGSDTVRVTGGTNSMTNEELEQQITVQEEQITNLRANVETWKEKGERATALELENSELTAKNEKLEKRQSDDSDTIGRLVDEKAQLQKDVNTMKPMADEGTHYRGEEEISAYNEYVRFRGEDLNEDAGDSERTKNTLNNLPTIKDVRDMGKVWAENADFKYPEGRKSSDTGGTPDPADVDKDTDDVVPGVDAY